jgi:hypothetical protein
MTIKINNALSTASYKVFCKDLLKVIGILPAMLFILVFTPVSADAQPDWEVNLKVTAGSAYNNLTLGADSTASDGFDNLWDTYAYLGGQLRAYFPHSEWNMAQDIFWRDIRANQPSTTKTWTMEVDSDLSGSTHTIEWDLSKIPASFVVTLTNNQTSEQIDMRSASSYSFTYSGVRTFTIAVTTDADSDGDGVYDAVDNCSMTPNPNQQNTDSDPYGNACDADLDNDGFVGPNDYTIFGNAWWSNPSSPNWNANADLDSDGFVGPNDYTLFGARWWSDAPWH